MTTNYSVPIEAHPATAPVEPAPKKLYLLVTADRLDDMNAKTYRNADKSSHEQVNFIAHFLADVNGVYVGTGEAIKYIDDNFSVRDLREMSQEIMRQMGEAAAPKK